MAPRERATSPLDGLALVGGIGLNWALSIVLGIGLGHLADGRFHTTPWFTLIGLALGLAGGFWGMMRLVSYWSRRFRQ